MYICPKCKASMKYVYTKYSGYWICRTCGFTPKVVSTNKCR